MTKGRLMAGVLLLLSGSGTFAAPRPAFPMPAVGSLPGTQFLHSSAKRSIPGEASTVGTQRLHTTWTAGMLTALRVGDEELVDWPAVTGLRPFLTLSLPHLPTPILPYSV